MRLVYIWCCPCEARATMTEGHKRHEKRVSRQPARDSRNPRWRLKRANFSLAWIYGACICLSLLTGCAKSIHHDEKLAAQRALEFARIVLIDKNADRGYELLSANGKRHVPLDKFKQTVAAMNARGYPTRVSATDYEPMPGEQAIYIYLRGQNGDEQTQYRVTLEGSSADDYRVLKIDQGSAFPTFSNQKRKFDPPLSAP